MQFLKSCVVALVLTLVSCNFEKGPVNLCLNPGIEEFVKPQQGVNHKVQLLWSELKEKGYVSKTGEDAELRPSFVNMQFIFESAVASMLGNNKVKRAIGVIYTPYPPTPLRTDGVNFNGLVAPEAESDPKRFNSLVMRNKSLNNYLSNGGKLYAIHKKVPEDVKFPGAEAYSANLVKYQDKLFDKPVDNFDERYTGASYLVECENGERILFSISGRQINDVKNGLWTLYYGSVKGDVISRELSTLRNVYASHGLDFDF